MQDNAADELDIEGAQTQDPGGGLPGCGKGLGQEIVQGLAAVQALLELRGLAQELGVGEIPILRLQGVDGVHQGRQALELPLVFTAENLFQN